MLVFGGVAALFSSREGSLSCAWLLPTGPQASLDVAKRRSALLGAACLVSAASPASAASSTVSDLSLANGMTIPAMSLNTAGLTADEAEKATRLAVSAGIRHIDFHPGIERDGVARVLREQGRDSMFLTTKIRKYKDSPPDSRAAAAAARTQIDEDFQALGVKSVDMLLLRDSPSCDVMQAQWAVLEEALASGRASRIGVINYCESSLSCLLSGAKVTPAVNYFMLHAGMGPDPQGLRAFGEARGINTFAYGPLGEPGPSGELLENPVLRRIAAAHGRTAAQVAIRWVVQTGAAVSVRPTVDFGLGKGSCQEPGCGAGLKERVQAFGWSLTPGEMAEISALTSPGGNPTLFSSPGCKGCFGCQ